jgi:nitrite reductase (NADH) small subunit
MQRIKMGKLSDLPPGTAIEKRILARRIAVFNVGGTLYGIESECKHMKATLVKGGVQNNILTCNWHGWQYNLITGECLTRPGMKLKRYDIEVVNDEIFLLM